MSAVTPELDLGAALDEAHLPTLLLALGCVSGEWDAVRACLPERLRIAEPDGGMTDAQRRATRALALRVLADPAAGAPQTVARASVLEGLRILLGEQCDAYAELALEELAIDDPDPRAPGWSAPPRDANADADRFDVLVIGAGMSGLLAAHRLAQAGVRFAVLEQRADLGGTWLENTYPGCRVDVPSHLYSYSCLGAEDWPHAFATQPEVHAGYHRFVSDHDLTRHIRFQTTVTRAVFEDGAWTVITADGSTLRTTILLSAVGQLRIPGIPQIPGREAFAGRQFHTAQWDHTAPVAGARYAVVGTGASAIQVITGLVAAGAEVTVFQRSATWLMPTPELRQAIAPGQRALLRGVPTYARWYRLWLLLSIFDGILPFAECDPEWTDPRAVSARNDGMRRAFTAYLERQFGGDPELLAAMVPDYPPLAKRAIRDDGSYARAFTEQGARLVTAPIERVEADGIRTADGALHAVDVIVWATGFQASEFLVPMEIVGRGGERLHDRWGADPTAYLGMAVPGFPNLFLLYGPNTNTVVIGSATFFTECQLRLLMDAVRRAVTDGATLEVRADVHDAFVAEIDGLSARRAWGCAGVHNWYLSPSGRVSQSWPSTGLDYWRRTAAVDPSAFHLNAKEPHA